MSYCGNPILTVGIDTKKIAAGSDDLVLLRLDPPRYCPCRVACAWAGPELPLPTLNSAVDKGRMPRAKKPYTMVCARKNIHYLYYGVVLLRLDPPRDCPCRVACAWAGPESPLPTLNTAVDKGLIWPCQHLPLTSTGIGARTTIWCPPQLARAVPTRASV